MQYHGEQIAQPAAVAVAALGTSLDEPSSGIANLLRFVGWTLVALGAWLLFVSPGEGAELYDRPIENIHALSTCVSIAVSGFVVLCAASPHSAIRDVRNRLTRG
jgi:hypothetical protein